MALEPPRPLVTPPASIWPADGVDAIFEATDQLDEHEIHLSREYRRNLMLDALAEYGERIRRAERRSLMATVRNLPINIDLPVDSARPDLEPFLALRESIAQIVGRGHA